MGYSAQNAVQFYFSINTNCQGNCTVTGNGMKYTLTESNYGASLTIPTVQNSRGGDDWLYLAWLNTAATSWTYEIVDPYTNLVISSVNNGIAVPTNQPGSSDAPGGNLQTFATFMVPPNPGLSGYMTMTVELAAPWDAPPDPVTNQSMNVANIYAAK